MASESTGLSGDKLYAGQVWVYFVTWWAYAANHITRKCYTNVKNVLKAKGFPVDLLGRMDSGFMFTYAFGAPCAGQLGDRYDAAKVIGLGLYGSALCIFLLTYGVWMGYEKTPWIANAWFLSVYLIFGFFQAIGGPVGTSVMGNWMCTPGAKKNRGLIYGTWTTHQYFGNILAPVIILGVSATGVAWWWGLMWPVILNIAFGALCWYGLSERPPVAGAPPPSLSAVREEKVEDVDEKPPLSIGKALAIPGVAGYCIAFGFMKLINYVLFFWLPMFLQQHFDSDTANMISTLYDFGMMPGGIIVGKVSDMYGGRRGCVIVTFLLILCPLLFLMGQCADTMATPPLLIILFTMGILIGGPNNIVTSAVAADLAEDPSVMSSRSGLGTVVGLINGSGSFIAAIGQLLVPTITEKLGWAALWYFMLIATVVACLLMGPKLYNEIFNWTPPGGAEPAPKKGYAAISPAENKA